MKNIRRKKKILLAVCCVLIASLFMCGCAGACITLPVYACGAAFAACTAGEYQFVHEAESFDDVTIELVVVEYIKDENGMYDREVIHSVKIIDDEDKEAFLEEFRELNFIIPFGEPVYGITDGKAFCFTWPDGQTEVVTTYGCELYADRTLEEYVGGNGFTISDWELYALWDKWEQAQ